MKRIVVTGGTGFVGRHLVSALVARGDEVTVLSRDPDQVRARFEGAVRLAAWQPDVRSTTPAARSWFAHLNGQDAVVHLAGEQAVGVRYTQAAKRRIYDSRVESTFQIVEAIAEAEPRPSTLISASGVGYYGGQKTDEAFDESAAPGTDFLATVCRDWEDAARRASDYGVRVVCARFGIVLGRNGGALEKMSTPFKMFAGGPIGTGEQIVSWIHIDDLVRALLLCIDDKSLKGPINATAPHAVSNREFSRALGHALHRPSWFRVPELTLKAALGEGAEPILTGQRAVPRVLQNAGFHWQFPELPGALQQALAS